MCKDCEDMVRKIKMTRGTGMLVEARLGVPGSARLMKDGKEVDISGTEQLPFEEST